ncbi:hypothetical protein J2Z50_003392 [Ensifer mexicanus]|nr:hypothetical protein [Sinorhizobium mexicanum]
MIRPNGALHVLQAKRPQYANALPISALSQPVEAEMQACLDDRLVAIYWD